MIRRFQICRGGQLVYDARFLDHEAFIYQPSDFHDGLAGFEFRVFPDPDEDDA